MKIHYRVQHAAGRTAGLDRLLPLLPPAVEVVTEEAPRGRPWPNYLRCLENAPQGATHLCILQDDALPCKSFDSLVEQAVDERPDEVISLFVGGLSGRTRKDFWAAQARGDRWSPIYFREIHHVVALCWPIPLVEEFLAWYPTARIPGPKPPHSDDAVIGYWGRQNMRRKLFWATVPCLVEHPDDLGSTLHPKDDSRIGSSGRRAIAFIDDLAQVSVA